MRIVVIGGGYAGLACLARLARVLPDAERILVEPNRWHLRRTRLHETLRVPLADVRAEYGPIARRWDFRHHHLRLDCSAARLQEWSRTRRIPLGRRQLEFDALVLATGLAGAPPRLARGTPAALPLEALATGAGVLAWKRMSKDPRPAWVVGAGASGLQCLFELAALRPAGASLGLVEAEDGILAAEPAGLRREVHARLGALGIELHLRTRYAGAGRGRIRLSGPDGETALPAGGILLCTGPGTRPLESDASGRLLLDGRPLPAIFAAGDCARWRGVPFDAATAQTAVRKGRHVAETIASVLAGAEPAAWDSRQLGFFLSLGPQQAVGWLFSRAALMQGLPAIAAREAVEARWDLLLRGVDSFAAF